LDALWRHGSLEHLLDSNQLDIYRRIMACTTLQFVIEASRKIGKSYLLAVIAFEAAIRSPGKRINYAAPSGKEAVEITFPIMSQIAALAPDDCRPVWKPSIGHWEFPDGGFIVLFGADDTASADRGRGPESVLNIVDEGAFTPVLFYLLESVLAPQTLQTRGRTIIGSTPPVSPGHEFADVADNAAALGAYVHRDIYSHGRMTREEIDAYLTQRAQSRGLTLEAYKLTTDFLREYGALRVLDSNLAVLPEFPGVRDEVVVARERPPFFDLYISGDPGMDDLTGLLFAVSDFQRSKLLIEHELLLHKANTRTIAEAVQDLLAEFYPVAPDSPGGLRLNTVKGEQGIWYAVRPYSAVIDDSSKRVCADLHGYHGLSFSPAQKDDREAAINVMRLEVAAKKIEIHPRCVHLVRQLGTAVRAKPGGDMARNKRDAHFDLVSSLWYLVRSWNKTHNPYPPDWNLDNRVRVRPLPQRQTLGSALLAGTDLYRRR
jgi:hypothetical protein